MLDIAEVNTASRPPVPLAVNNTDLYRGAPWTILGRSWQIPEIISPNSFSRGQMSGTTSDRLTEAEVVAGPGFKRMFLFISIFISI